MTATETATETATSHMCQKVDTGESYIFYFGIYILWAFKVDLSPKYIGVHKWN